MRLKEYRKELGLTQPEAANLLNVPFRTYCRYENEIKYENSFKYNQFFEILTKYSSKRILKLERIKEIVDEVLKKYPVTTCYLFGSYAKGKALENSDVDLMIVSDIDGLDFFKLNDELERRLMKKVDLIKLSVAVQNVKLMNNILNEGFKIYG